VSATTCLCWFLAHKFLYPDGFTSATIYRAYVNPGEETKRYEILNNITGLDYLWWKRVLCLYF
jgi:hypothetical protein